MNLQESSLFFKCFRDEARSRLLYLIFKAEEMCIADLELILDYTQTKTSRHLSYLKNAQLLKFKKNDQWVYYFINPSYLKEIKTIFDLLQPAEFLNDDLYEYRTLYTNNELAIRKLHIKEKKYKLPEL